MICQMTALVTGEFIPKQPHPQLDRDLSCMPLPYAQLPRAMMGPSASQEDLTSADSVHSPLPDMAELTVALKAGGI